MVKRMLILLLALLFACACEDNSYRGYEFAPEQFRLSQSVRVAV